ncbi:MAG: hypothetical protein RMK97_11070 [Sutterellaceae bacterium]|nr:hypothetical protein [Burkholderiaceae bacterium]MCX7900683.1 hypothetical protein [Burkholderiaceae bacterium]MDW8431020.1 hypothetical protein [Sutterellaceae bacterium]
MTAQKGKPVLDLEAAARLVERLEQDLAQARTGSGDLARVRDEVEQLRALLAAQPAQEQVHAGFSRLRETLHALRDELARDAFEVGDYLARIGRLLGL